MTESLPIPAKLALAGSALFGLLFFSMGIAWLVMPAFIAQVLDASLLQDTGLATQVGDSAAFFLCSGGFMLYGVVSRHSAYLIAGALLIGLVAPARIIAWQVHGAALTAEFIIVEVVAFLVVLAAARSLRAGA